MKFCETKISGAYFIDLDKSVDDRGFFANTWEKKLFQQNKLNVNLTECNIAFTKKKGTIRGLHYQIAPNEGAKLIRCTKGKIWDITLDLRPNSNTFKQWISVELSANNHTMNYVPEGCAHGYQTLEDNCEVFYLMSQDYDLSCEQGIHYADPSFNMTFPLKVTLISEKDNTWKSFNSQSTKI
jgi:dTDP-4-dehydrorhamnose 3,5-epimerase